MSEAARTRSRRTAGPFFVLAAAISVLALLSLALGPAGFGLPDRPEARWLILGEIRLPRTLLAAAVGAALGAAGAALQGYLRNPLAEPGLIGITGGAAFGAVVTIHAGLAGAAALALPLGGLAGALAALAAVLLLAGPRSAPLGLILAGVAVASLAAALTTLALTLAPNPFAQTEIVIWLMGSLADRSLLHVSLAVPLIAIGVWVLVRSGPDLDALALGEEVAQNLGVDLARLRLSIVAGTALAVGSATAVAGGITFVGLIVPHLLRPHLGHRPGPLVLASAFGGAVLVMTADIAVRLLAPLADVKLGVLIALVGAPFFLWLVITTQRETAP